MRENLGQFELDAAFNQLLMRRLTTKYGPTSGWDLVLPMMDSDGQRRNKKAAFLDAMLEGGEGGAPVELIVKMLDFRVIWIDEAAINQRPKGEAERALAF
jgi:hypothetical protein